MKEISTHRVDLPFNGIAYDSTFGPTLGHHGTYPDRLNWKQACLLRVFNCTFFRICLKCLDMQLITVQGEMLSFGNNMASKHSLKLWPGFKPLHARPYVG